MCWTTRTGRGKLAGSAADDPGEGRRPAGRGGDGQDAGGFGHLEGGGQRRRRSDATGPFRADRPAPDHRHGGHDAQLRADLAGGGVVAGIGGGHRLLDHREGPGPQGVHRDAQGGILDRIGDDHDRGRALGHDPPRRLQAIDARQTDIHRDDVRADLADRRQRLLAGGHGRHDFQARIAADDVDEELAHHEGILDQHHPHPRGRSRRRSVPLVSAHSNCPMVSRSLRWSKVCLVR